MKKYSLGNRVLAMLCVVLMLGMMLTGGGFTAVRDPAGEEPAPAPAEESVTEPAPVTAAELVAESIAEPVAEPAPVTAAELVAEPVAEPTAEEPEAESVPAAVVEPASFYFDESGCDEAVPPALDGVPVSYKVFVESSNAGFDGIVSTVSYKSGDSTQDCAFTIDPTEHYTLPDNITVEADGSELTKDTTDTKNDYSWNPAGGELVIHANTFSSLGLSTSVTVTVTVVAVPISHKVTFTGTDIAYVGDVGNDSCKETEDYTATLSAEGEFAFPTAITVNVSGTLLTAGSGYTYDQGTGRIVIPMGSLTGDVSITAVGRKFVNVSLSGEGVSDLSEAAKKAYPDEDYSVTLTAKPHYSLPASVVVSVNGALGVSYTLTDGLLTIAKEDITGTIAITANAVEHYYYVVSLGDASSNVSFAEESVLKAYPGEDYSVTLKAADYYDLPTAVTAELGGESFTDFSYETGVFSIASADLPVLTNGNSTINITAVATKHPYTVVNNIDGVDCETSTVTHGGAWDSEGSTVLIRVPDNSSFSVPEKIELYIGGVKCEDDYSVYFYEKTKDNDVPGKPVYRSAKIRIFGDKVTGDITLEGSVDKTFGLSLSDSLHATLPAGVTLNYQDAVNVEITAKSGYTLPEELSTVCVYTVGMVYGTLSETMTTVPKNVTEDTDTGTAAVTGYTWTLNANKTGTLTIDGTFVTGRVVVTGTALLNDDNYKIESESGKNDKGWYNKPVLITKKDPASGVSLDGTGEVSEWPASITVKDGIYTEDSNSAITVYVADGSLKSAGEAVELKVDTTVPEVTAGAPTDAADNELNSYTENGVTYYYTNSEVIVKFGVKEKNVDVTNSKWAVYMLNGVERRLPTTSDLVWSEDKSTASVHYGPFESGSDDEGRRTFKLNVVDEAGNSVECSSDPIVLDNTAPETQSIAYYTQLDPEMVTPTPNPGTVGSDEYNIYSLGTVTVKVTARDALSPIQQLHITDDTGGVNITAEDGVFSFSCEKDDSGYVATCAFTVAAQYKDKLTAVATDLAGNVENPAKPANKSNLLLDTVAPTVAFTDPDYDSVHSSDYTLGFTVEDPNSALCSGLESISYVICGDKGGVTKAEGTILPDEDDKWTRSVDKEIAIPASLNSNLVYVVVTVTDLAGNTATYSTKDYGYFKMDNTAPVITASFTGTAQNGTYFNTTRTATITVTDNNFSEEHVTIVTAGSRSSWTASGNNADGEANVHTCTVSYTADGDYTFTMNARDLGGNSTANGGVSYSGSATGSFTIDLTAPVYNVSFRNGGAAVAGGGYSQGTVTVTLTVTEHNFNVAYATAGLTVTKDGKDISASVRSLLSWSSVGDQRTAVFTLSEDGEYTVDMSLEDLAGNKTAAGGAKGMFIDQTDPAVSVAEVRNQSANAAQTIAPVVTIRDKYYNADGVKIVLKNGKGEDVTARYLPDAGVSGVEYDAENDVYYQTFTFDNLDTDDIYRLTAVMTDLSGRVNTVMTVLDAKGAEQILELENNNSLRFSVNREGSAYSADDETLAVLGQYVKAVGDVHILETNVDELEPESIHITLTHDSNTRDLESGVDYSYQIPPEENESGWRIYEYVLNESLFTEDGVYTVTIYSQDMAGNISQNNTEKKSFEITFVVDKTAPIFVAVNLAAGAIYNEAERVVTINCSDNIALDTVQVFWLDSTAEKSAQGDYVWDNAKELKLTPVEGSEGDFTFVLTEGESAAGSRQSVLVVCTDKAGNTNTDQQIPDFTISSNLWIRFYANKPVFYGSIGGVVLLMVGVGVVFTRKNESDKKKTKA